MKKPQLDETKAHEYIGKTILLGVTYLDHDESILEQKQWYGTIETFSNSEGIKIKLKNSNEPCCLPPDPRGIRKAEPGTYRLKSTGEEVINPDYLAAWTAIKSKQHGAKEYVLPGMSSGRKILGSKNQLKER